MRTLPNVETSHPTYGGTLRLYFAEPTDASEPTRHANRPPAPTHMRRSAPVTVSAG